MKVLVVGSGGREHALAWKLLQSPLVSELTVAPGNAGISRDATCVPIPADRINELVDYSKQADIDLVVVGPEAPLSLGLADRLKDQGISVFGPGADAARLESSKAFAKAFCRRHSIPTADFDVCSSRDEILQKAAARSYSCVIKADGLAAGKGVFVCKKHEDVACAVHSICDRNEFGSASERVIVEDLLEGEEVSILTIADGSRYIILDTSQDHKAAFDNDTGPNTGGMGAYSPAPVVTPDLMSRIERTIIAPAISGMKAENHPFCGVLYAGLMISHGHPMLLEFNVRFGDPETQPLLMRLESDLAELLSSAASGHLDHKKTLKWSPDPAVCVVMASGGYPGRYDKGYEIKGLNTVESLKNTKVFHAGTAFDSMGRIVSAGGRVLGITAKGSTIGAACETAYRAVNAIQFSHCFFRKDIAYRALAREP